MYVSFFRQRGGVIWEVPHLEYWTFSLGHGGPLLLPSLVESPPFLLVEADRDDLLVAPPFYFQYYHNNGVLQRLLFGCEIFEPIKN
jgi:hypothetical protein